MALGNPDVEDKKCILRYGPFSSHDWSVRVVGKNCQPSQKFGAPNQLPLLLQKISCLCYSIKPRDMSFQMLALSGFVLTGNGCGAFSGLHLWTPTMNSGIKALLVHCAKCIGKIRIFFVLSNFLLHHFDVKCQNIAKHPPKTFPYSSKN